MTAKSRMKTLSLRIGYSNCSRTMKIFIVWSILFLPCITFGQLFPKVPDFKGNIKQVVEKRYGKEGSFLNLFKAKYHPNEFSGWKYTYHFDKHTKLVSQTSSFNGKVIAEYLYQRDTMANRFVEREITSEKSTKSQGDYTEYENFIGPEGRVEKVNFWAFNSKECTRQLFMVEQNVEYRKNKLLAFTRQNIKAEGDTASAEKCILYYDSSDKLIRIERKDIETGFATILYYYYNNQGFIDHYSIDYLVGLSEYGKKNQTQEVYFECDRQGNWITMYRKSGKKNLLEAKRHIEYF